VLDLKFIRENAEAVKENCKNRGVRADGSACLEATRVFDDEYERKRGDRPDTSYLPQEGGLRVNLP
jgi:seryl-tRNA synthetase